MTKSMWIAVTILLSLFTACGAFMVMLQKDEEQKNVQNFLTRHKLQNNIAFRSVSLSVSDVLTLENVSVNFAGAPRLKNITKKFIIHDYKETRRIPTLFTASAENIRLRLQDIASSQGLSEEAVLDRLSFFDPVRDMSANPLYTFLLAGCNELKASAKIKYVYYPDAKKMNLNLDVRDKCLGRWEAAVSLKNITNAQQGRLVVALRHIIQKGNVANDLKEFLNGAVVTSLSFSYTESSLVAGYKKFVDTLYLRMPNQPSPAEPDSKDIQKIVSYLSFSNAHRQRNTDIANTLAAFIRAPDKITFQSRPGKEVPLHVLSGDFGRRLTDLLLRLDTSVTLEKSSFEF